MPEQDILKDYELIRELNISSGRQTWLAQELSSGQQVVLKSQRLSQSANWKQLELFEREAQFLAHLSHPALPKFVRFAHVSTDSDVIYFLVTEYISGESLQEKLDAGWRPDDSDCEAIALAVLAILKDLHALHPAVIHRDIKPSNLILNSAGQVFLIDFGAMNQVLKPQGGSTAAGTFGYMAPEQLTGQAEPVSDLYGLGATLLHLLTGQHPADLARKRLLPDFAQLKLSKRWQDWLERLLAPIPEDRFASAELATAALTNSHPARLAEQALQAPVVRLPTQTRLPNGIVFQREADDLQIDLPPRESIQKLIQNYYLKKATFPMAIVTLFLAACSLLVPVVSFLMLELQLFMVLFSLLYWGLMTRKVQGQRVQIRTGPGGGSIQIQGPRQQHVQAFSLLPGAAALSYDPKNACLLAPGLRSLIFLSPSEWLALETEWHSQLASKDD